MLMATAVVILPAVPNPNIICLIYIPAIGSEYVAIPIFAILSRAAAKRNCSRLRGRDRFAMEVPCLAALPQEAE